MNSRNTWTLVGLLGLLLGLPGNAVAADPLREGFASPPAEARPRVWWHWMNGNVTRDGIAKDLAWLSAVGVGGVQNFDANLATPQIVSDRLVFMTPPWKDAFRFAVNEADRLGLEFAIAASPGWSETGGPWVPADDGLKKVVWTETRARGGVRFSGRLAAPPDISGPFMDLPLVDAVAQLQGGEQAPPPRHYGDIGVFAVPVLSAAAAEVPGASAGDGTQLDAAALADDLLQTAVTLPRGTADPASIRLTYSMPRTIRSATFFLEGGAGMFQDAEFTPALEARVDGAWRRVAVLPVASVPTTVSFAPVAAREFRLVLEPNREPGRQQLGEGAAGVVAFNLFGASPGPLRIGALRLFEEPRIHRFEAKAGFALVRDYYALEGGDDAPAVRLDQVIDLSSRLRPDGTLDWSPPAGEWRILRFGHSLLGTTNHPATPEATGLEVDKFDGPAVRRYAETYLKMYRDTVGSERFGARGLRALLTDSIEVGAANWTPRMLDRFRELRGYDPRPWLPALAGVVLESRARSDAFLYDYRRTLADLMASDHYGTVAAVAREHGLKLYGEALEDGRPSLGDDMAMRAHADTPMAALWVWNRGFAPRPTLLGDMKGASSVAHVYGKPFVAAESMTAYQSPWAFAPSDLRRVIDLEFAYGINRPVIHTSVHQPVDDKQPGLSLAIFGQYFNRHETWAGMARPWIDYMARTSYLLQQGRNVADVAYFYGEEQPLTALYAGGPLQDVPVHHAFDFVNAEILQRVLQVRDGALVTAGGASYRALYLGGTSQRMTVAVLRRIATLVEAGATVIGTAPLSSPALQDDPAAFAALVRQLWSGGPVTRLGKGRVIAGGDIESGLEQAGVKPDFQYARNAPDSELLFVHRRLGDADIYFVNNRRNAAEKVDVRFRVQGRRPEIWRADTGTVHRASWRAEAGATVVSLELVPEDSLFVVFRAATSAKSETLSAPGWREATALDDNWVVAFQAGRGAPATASLSRLQPLQGHADPGIRYFSGVATYSRDFELPGSVRPGTALQLDLGAVGDIAEVWVNGRRVGISWHTPHRIDIGPAVRSGRNQLQIRVANLWVNRLIGDAQPGAKPITFTTLPTYLPDAPLRPSGLLGPVRLLQPATR